MAPWESEDSYQHYSYHWTYDTGLYVSHLEDISFILEQPPDLALPFSVLHLQEWVNRFRCYANLHDCGASHGIEISSDL